jgi:butyrate kinase
LRILVVNPGSTTTRLAVFADGREVFSAEVEVPEEELSSSARTADQAPARMLAIRKSLEGAPPEGREFDAIAARGGPLAAVPGGTYRINAAMLEDARSPRFVDHASRLGCILADELVRARAGDGSANIPAFVVDPVSTDEYEPLARISGLPELPRKSLTHALSIKASAHRCAEELGRPISELGLLVAHLGGGISIAALDGGRMVDSVDANGEGPMSPQRSGGLRVDDLVDMCFSGNWTREELKRKLTRGAGLVAHLGTSDAVEVERRATDGDERAGMIYEALGYQVSKHIAALAAVLRGRVDAVVLTGGLARSEMLVESVGARVSFLGNLVVYPGENEMRALYEGVRRVLCGEEPVRTYPSGEEEGQPE